eukprot:TRINITY_DN11306_c0_g1_i1.p1 TRINITY_DN11306_c0_g1~~TRINITY_DN11306_c0_g1_i1.p1  ORF type:complete len:579 (-),score=124.89 TRINITY_DN11306_c0_g1_i1:45-1781(-)
MAKVIIYNAKIHTLQEGKDSEAKSIVIGEDGNIVYVGSDLSDQELFTKYKKESTKVIDAHQRTVIPGLNDSHLHLIRAALYYNQELRWDGVPSLKIALDMLKNQAQRTPKGQWVKVVGGWSEHQFIERRLPTLDEINAATGDTPCFILYLYGLAFINKSAIQLLNYSQNTSYPGGEVVLDSNNVPTGLLIAKPSPLILYSTLGLTPTLSPSEQISSTIQYYRELNRLGLTSAVDPGGGNQNFPEHYQTCVNLAKQSKLTLRIAYYIFAQVKNQEIEQFKNWIKVVAPGDNVDPIKQKGFCMCGAGENIVWSAADFENYLEPRPDLDPIMEQQLLEAITLFVSHRWPFRIHATYNESISRFLNVFEKVNQTHPFNGLHWLIDHAETVSDENLDRIKALGGGIAIQNRMFFQGESFISRYGAEAVKTAPPMKKIIAKGIPMGLGTDGTRVSSYNPWLSLYWCVSGKSWSGVQMYDEDNRLDRTQALRFYTKGSAWIGMEENLKGELAVGKFGDLVVLSDDYFSVEEEKIKEITSVLTVVNGDVVWGDEEFKTICPELEPIVPEWSPVKTFGGYFQASKQQ